MQSEPKDTITWYDDSYTTLIIRTKNIADYLAFFNQFGLKFRREQHGNSAVHYSSMDNGHLIEIYPHKDTKNEEA